MGSHKRFPVAPRFLIRYENGFNLIWIIDTKKKHIYFKGLISLDHKCYQINIDMATPAGEELIKEVKDLFRSYLVEKKHRQTPERFMVLEEIYRADGHIDADDMYFRMKNTGTRVSRATVYNTLDLLVECGLVQRHQFGKNQSIYERAYAFRQHDHIICSRCGKVIEFCDPRLHEIKTMMEKIHDFKIEGHSLHFYGTCNNIQDCEESPDNKKRKKIASALN